MTGFLSVVLIGIGMMLLIYVAPYRHDRSAVCWAKALSATCGGGFLVFGGGAGVYALLLTGEYEQLKLAWMCVCIGTLLTLASGVVRFRRERP